MPPLRLELISEIINHGANHSEGRTTDPSTNVFLFEAGAALVTTYLEQLAALEIIKDVSPIFGQNGGMWIGYQLSQRGRDLSKDSNQMRRAVADLIGGPKSEVSEAVYLLKEQCLEGNINENYQNDFLRTLEEIAICFDNACYIATISLCGKILEICLKEMLTANNINFPERSTIGALMRTIRENNQIQYLDPALTNMAHIINTSRITAIHALERIPIPSRDQTIMVIFAMRDLVKRHIERTNIH